MYFLSFHARLLLLIKACLESFLIVSGGVLVSSPPKLGIDT